MKIGGLPISDMEERELEVSWRHWNQSVFKEKFKAQHFCLMCLKSPPILPAAEFLQMQDRYLVESFKKF